MMIIQLELKKSIRYLSIVLQILTRVVYVLCLFPPTTSGKKTSQAALLVEGLGAIDQDDGAEDSEGKKEGHENEDVVPPRVLLDVVFVDDAAAKRRRASLARLERRVELGEDEQVHAVLRG